MLTADQHESFDQRGWCRLASVFPTDQAHLMVERIWDTLERQHGVRRDAPETWHITQATGLQALRRESIFQSIGSADACAALDDLLGTGRWRRSDSIVGRCNPVWRDSRVVLNILPETRDLRGDRTVNVPPVAPEFLCIHIGPPTRS